MIRKSDKFKLGPAKFLSPVDVFIKDFSCLSTDERGVNCKVVFRRGVGMFIILNVLSISHSINI